MVKILLARAAGACYGVERALKIVDRLLKKEEEPIHTLGPLIHNPQLIEELKTRGASPVATVADAAEEASAPLVIRAHGVAPEVIKAAKDLQLRLQDATCPYVKQVHREAALFEKQGYQVIIIGDPGHPEVIGIQGHAPSAWVALKPSDLAELPPLPKRVALVVQTTQPISRLDDMADAIRDQVEELKIADTICAATTARQNAAIELSQCVDVMFVVGGRISANTNHLADVCKRHCPLVYHIEKAEEIKTSWLARAKTIGLTAGASTPTEQIASVLERLSELTGAEIPSLDNLDDKEKLC